MGDEYDALCLAGSRLGELGLTSVHAERIAGVVRHAWTSRQLAIGSAASRDNGTPPLLLGRIATIVYLPAGRQLPVGPTVRDGRWEGAIGTMTIDGKAVRVPTRAAQLVESAIQRRVVDVACLLVGGIEHTEVLAEAARRRRGAAVSYAIEVISELLGQPTVGQSPWPVVPTTPAARGLERLRRSAGR